MESDDITRLLSSLRERGNEIEPRLLEAVYAELRKIARRHMRAERDNHTLNSTALVHEAYLRLLNSSVPLVDRVHFFALASRIMRQILVDYARNRQASKRYHGAVRIELTDLPIAAQERTEDLVALDEAMNRLAEFAPRQAKIIEMRFFGGMTAEDVAEHFGLSVRTIHREWLLAKSWLLVQLKAV